MYLCTKIAVAGGKILVMGYMEIPAPVRPDVLYHRFDDEPPERTVLPHSASMKNVHPALLTRSPSEPRDIGSQIPLHPRLVIARNRVHVKKRLSGWYYYSLLNDVDVDYLDQGCVRKEDLWLWHSSRVHLEFF